MGSYLAENLPVQYATMPIYCHGDTSLTLFSIFPSQRLMQYLASRNTLFNLNNFLDKAALQGDLMPFGCLWTQQCCTSNKMTFCQTLSGSVTPSIKYNSNPFFKGIVKATEKGALCLLKDAAECC